MKRLRPLDSGDPDNPSKRALLFEAYRRPALDRPGTYDTRNLVVALVQRLGLRHATDLANLLGVTAPSVHRLCHHAGHPVSAAMLVALSCASGLPVHELRRLMGDRRSRLRLTTFYHDLAWTQTGRANHLAKLFEEM